MSIYSHSLSYLNESARGPLNESDYLLGSNVDWGQDLVYFYDLMDFNDNTYEFVVMYNGGFNPMSTNSPQANYKKTIPREVDTLLVLMS